MNTDFKVNLRRYTYGFVASLLLTIASFLAAQLGSGEGMLYLIVGVLLLLAGIQMIIQLYCFLHLKYEHIAYSKLNVFLFSFIMLLIVVIGSIWVMKNLDYNMMMPQEEIDSYMLEQNGKGF